MAARLLRCFITSAALFHQEWRQPSSAVTMLSCGMGNHSASCSGFPLPDVPVATNRLKRCASGRSVKLWPTSTIWSSRAATVERPVRATIGAYDVMSDDVRYFPCPNCGKPARCPARLVKQYAGQNVTLWCQVCQRLFDVQLPPQESPRS
jgi:hypothetical protein